MESGMKVRAVFISDTHLGSGAAHPEELLQFLKELKTEYLFIVGDFLDFWIMSKKVRWNNASSGVIQQILKMARHGTKVIYIPGNHDEHIRQFAGTSFDNIQIVNNTTYDTLRAKTLFITHGDEFDQVVKLHPTISKIGALAYDTIVRLNRWVNRLRRRMHLKRWSFSSYIKNSVKDAVKFVTNFEQILVDTADRQGYDGVICGHIHAPCVKKLNGLDYINCGDWVENLTAVIEDYNGNIYIYKHNS
jgi:UDP-2,3-diacylglucosamine pyrophosphatase LpxH